MMKVFRNRDVPALYVKYEDLKNKEALNDVCKYIFNKKSIQGTVIASRLITLKEFSRPHEFSNSIDQFSPEQQDFVKSRLYDFMEFFGYYKQGDTGIHDYPELLHKLRETYKKNLVDPTGGKEPLKYREFIEANADTILKNSRYKDDYRKKKILKIENKVIKVIKAKAVLRLPQEVKVL
jgi:hypothetical protein